MSYKRDLQLHNPISPVLQLHIPIKLFTHIHTHTPLPDTPPPSEEDSEVAKITGHKPPPDSLAIQHDRTYTAPSPNHYLTLLPPSPKILEVPKRSYTEVQSDGPPVPPRRR